MEGILMIFLYFLNHPESAHCFRKYTFSKHQNINFTVEKKILAHFPFQTLKICRKNGQFVTSVYKKPTFSGVFTNYESFIPTFQKRGLLYTLLHRSFSICCDFNTFNFEIDHLKTILMKKIIPRISLICVLNHSLISCIHLKLLFRMYLKEMFSLSCRSWEVLRFKFERCFKNYFMVN